MADPKSVLTSEKDIEQAITTLKKGSYLLKYGRRGKPKFCPFHLSNDESELIWYSGREEKHLKLSQVSRIIPGQRTAIFKRYPRPEKEYQSFSLICSDRSLDLICKDKDEAEVWFVGLKALTSRGNFNKWRTETFRESIDSPHVWGQKKTSPSVAPLELEDLQKTQVQLESAAENRIGKVFSDIISYTATTKSPTRPSISTTLSSVSSAVDCSNGRSSTTEPLRISLSSAISSSSHGSCREDFDALGDVFIWGEGISNGVLGCGENRMASSTQMDANLPKALESQIVLDVYNIACGDRHAMLVTKQGEIFSWGEELGGRLGHGIESDISYPKLIDTLSGMNIELMACGEYHSCAVTMCGDLYTWGDGTHNSGMLGHGRETSHWIPKRVRGILEGIHISHVACGPWHTAVVTSCGRLFTFGDGAFGALGHGDHSSTNIPREVAALQGLRVMKVACGVWHTAAAVEVSQADDSSFESPCNKPSFGRLFTWGDGDKYQLGHGDKKPRLVPENVRPLLEENICQIACGYDFTVALTTSGRVYTMGSADFGQLGNSASDEKNPRCVEGKIMDRFVDQIACGSYHVVALTSENEVFTWGKGLNGQLGHGDNENRKIPTLVQFFKDKQVKSVACGSNFTATICLHKWVSSFDHSMCSGCHNSFSFRRKRHNCYNCGLVFCKACSSRKSLKASLAPNMNKPYRVCDDCFAKLKKVVESDSVRRFSVSRNDNTRSKSNQVAERDVRSKSQGPFGKIIFTEPITENRFSMHDLKPELIGNSLSPIQNKNGNLGGYNGWKEPTCVIESPTKLFSLSVPGSRIPSRSVSPLSAKSSPPRFSEVTIDDSKLSTDSLNQEITNLRAQVEDLTLKSQHLQHELDKTRKQLKQATAKAEGEARRCKSAKEVIKSLTAQLKDLAEKLPEEQRPPSQDIDSAATESSSDLGPASINSKPKRALTSESEFPAKPVDKILSNGTKQPSDKKERVIQDEPGVYITLSPLPGGGNELKRIRFSKKQFTEEQAETWWATNGTKLMERHNILSSHVPLAQHAHQSGSRAIT